ncbi:Rhodanese-like domain-containing protein [Cryomyces antarcticus]
MADTTTKPDSEAPWHAAFPKPTLTAPLMPRNRVLQILSLRGVGAMVLIDVRRTDYEGGTIRGSLNIPAQGFWWNRGMLYELCYKADIEWVVFYCGSSSGRGPRCAAWFGEYISSVGDENMQAMTLEGGIKGWVKAGPQYVRLMDGYQAEYWGQFEREEGGGGGGEVKKGAA